jgi:hypothetical protein
MSVNHVRSVLSKVSIELPDKTWIVSLSTMEFEERHIWSQTALQRIRRIEAANAARKAMSVEIVDQLDDPHFHAPKPQSPE